MSDSPPTRKRALGILAGLVFAGLVIPAAAVLLAMRSCSRAMVSGQLEVAGQRHTLDRCKASTTVPDEVELGNEKTPALVRVTIDPLDGPILVVDARTVPTRPCPGFKASLKRTSAADAPSPRYDGEVNGTCPLPDGGTISVSVWFRGCGA